MNMDLLKQKKSLVAVAIAASLGLAACHKDPADSQLSDSAAAEAPKESASIGAAVDDAGITGQVKERIASDSRTQNASIEVETNNGVVTLSGNAPDATSKAAAEELARNVAEVQGIDNKIQAPSALDDMSAKAGSAADKAGERVSDAVITTKVKAKLAEDSTVKARDIKGKVASQEAKQRAIELARNTEGVKSVDDDQLTVSQSS
jgi:hyperosmotically inducible protein